MHDLAEKYREIRSNIHDLLGQCHRVGDDVEFLAVSKGQPSAKIRQLNSLGQSSFGENYFQELKAKATELSGLNLEWHYIGQLQSRKIKPLVQICTCIHTLSSIKHAVMIAEAARSLNKIPFRCFIQVNISEQPQKFGCSLSEALQLFTDISAMEEIKLAGFMAIPSPLDHQPWSSELPAEYAAMRNLALRCNTGLSLGMSGDLRESLQAGSTCLRIGSLLFGPRI